LSAVLAMPAVHVSCTDQIAGEAHDAFPAVEASPVGVPFSSIVPSLVCPSTDVTAAAVWTAASAFAREA
jgi:hypothetical protein